MHLDYVGVLGVFVPFPRGATFGVSVFYPPPFMSLKCSHFREPGRGISLNRNFGPLFSSSEVLFLVFFTYSIVDASFGPLHLHFPRHRVPCLPFVTLDLKATWASQPVTLPLIDVFSLIGLLFPYFAVFFRQFFSINLRDFSIPDV